MSSKKKPIIAVDGPSGVGKSTLSRLLARHLGFTYIDTGAMYRAVALKVFETDIDIDDEDNLKEFCSNLKIDYKDSDGHPEIRIDNIDYTNEIRTGHAGKFASISSSKASIRDLLVSFQRKIGRDGDVVMEGRDIGTTVFPDADIKFYLDASPDIRARRRFLQITVSGSEIKLKDVKKGEQERDMRDSSRHISPLSKATDAIYIDTGSLSVQEVFWKMLEYVKGILE